MRVRQFNLLVKELLALVLFKLILDFSYVNFVSKYFSYYGFDLDFNSTKYIQDWVLTLLLFIYLTKKRWHNLYLIFNLVFILMIVPAGTLYSHRNEPFESFFLIYLGYFLFLLLLRKMKFKIRSFKGTKSNVLIISFFITLLVLLHYVYIKGFRVNYNLSLVYELRSKYGHLNNAGVFGYLNSWTTKIFNIVLIIWAFSEKKYFKLVFFILIQILLFGYSGHKQEIFSLLLIFVFYFLRDNRNRVFYLFISFTGVQIFALFLFYYLNDFSITSIVLRRTFFVPANLNYAYIEFFSNNELIYFSNGILKYFVTYPYTLSPTHLIGDYLYNDSNVGANTGIIGSGYMNLGVFGVVLYVFLTSVLVNFIYQLRNIPNWVINSIILLPLLSLFISSDFFTSMLTHGLLIAILVLYLLNNNYSNEKEDLSSNIRT